jgi:hemin uptake protein HemP
MYAQHGNTDGPSTASPPSVDPTAVDASAPPRAVRLCDRRHQPCDSCTELSSVRVIRSDELLQGERELFIVHGSQVYRLLCTKNDKLILQK